MATFDTVRPPPAFELVELADAETELALLEATEGRRLVEPADPLAGSAAKVMLGAGSAPRAATESPPSTEANGSQRDNVRL